MFVFYHVQQDCITYILYVCIMFISPFIILSLAVPCVQPNELRMLTL